MGFQSGVEAMESALGPVIARQRAESRADFDAEMLRLARADKARAMRGWDRQAALFREIAGAR